MRCHKKDLVGPEGLAGCDREVGHTGRCKVRLKPDTPRPVDWPCRETGCERRVKRDGARCCHHRAILNNHTRRRRGRPEGPGPAAAPRPPTPAPPAAAPERKPMRPGIVPLQEREAIAYLAARGALVLLARMILKTFAPESP